MRITLDSASEVSADETESLPVAGPSVTASPSAGLTPKRRGILRNPSSTQSVQTYSPHNNRTRSSQTPQNGEEENTPQRKERQSSAQTPPFQRRRQRSVTPAFELVGLPPSSSPVGASSPQSNNNVSKAEKMRSAPPWMQHSSLPRMTEVDPGFESSDEAVSSGSSISDSDRSTSTSSAEDEGTTDSEEESWPVGPATARSQTGRMSKRTRTRIRVKVNDEEWEEWNRASAQLAWDRARRSQSMKASGQDSEARIEHSIRPTSLSRGSSATKTSRPGPRLDPDVDEVRALLSSLQVKRTEQDEQTKIAFEARNAALWKGIDASILAAEREAKQAAAAESRRLEAARKAQAEAEQRAKEQRDQELERIEKEKKQAHEEADKKKKEAEEEQKRTQAALEQEQKAKAMGGSGADMRRNGEDEYQSWMARIERIKQDVLPRISGNPELRKQCFVAKRQITPKVGQLTNSRQEIARITQAIGSVLAAAKEASGANGEIYTWILNHLSKCLIRQAEQEVAAKQDTAYPLARVVVWLLLEGHRDLGDVLMARLVKKCPWVVAVWPPRKPDTDEATYRKLLGYKSADESTENYSNRMCGIFAFYVAILQTTPTAPPSGTSLDLALIADHLRPKAIWIWCVRGLTPPAPFLGHPLAPLLWSTFLEVGGNKALGLYGRQMQKLLRLMLDQGLGQKKAEFVQRESEGNVKAAMVRLELLLQAWSQNGRIMEATKGSEMEA